ncbi:phospholipid scramblase 2-like [Dermacentor andersoni]|uniref:phospholipid scramblase 2-like n=1 Tax=Dermacentor andersoni TaxID=34620 RepID=UPI002416B090|nr:phospholipid scramblase 1-like [Dermacentor andersoni]
MVPGPASRREPPGAGPAHPAAAGGSRTRTPIVSPPTTGVASQQATGFQMPAIPGCPPGLEYLTQIDQLIVRQSVNLVNMLMPNLATSEYLVTNTMDQFVFKATEDFDLACQGVGPRRPFQMALHDSRKAEVLRLVRPLRCDSCLCFCCLQKMDVRDHSGATIGSLRMQCTLLYPNFSVLDSEKNAILLIKGPCCTRSICCENVKFDIVTMDGVTKIGAITKLWGGLWNEACSVGERFAVTFPFDLDVKVKAVLLAAVFLLDSIYYEGGFCATCWNCACCLTFRTRYT